MRKKYIDGTGWVNCEKTSSHIIRVSDVYTGYVAIVNIEKVTEKLIVEYNNMQTCLYDNGHKSVVFLPDNENYCVEAMYDKKGNIVEWYFNITKINSIDEYGKHFYDDLYLDIAVMPNGDIIVLDEDELLDALNKKKISADDYDLAYKTCDKVKNNIITNIEFMVDFFNNYKNHPFIVKN